MLKFLVKAVFFSILLLILISFSGSFFLNKADIGTLKTKDYNDIKEDIDIAFFGSSHSYTAFDPRVFENELGLNAYNYGGGLQNFIVTLPVIKEVIKEKNIRFGVIDIFSTSIMEPPLYDKAANFQYKTLDYLPLSVGKIKAHLELFGKKNLLDIFPMFRRHAKWESIFDSEYVLSEEMDCYKGFSTISMFRKARWERSIRGKKVQHKNELLENRKLTVSQKKYIDDIIEVFQENDIPFLFVSAPIYKRYMDDKYYTYQKLIKEYLKKKEIIFIDYNDLMEELDLGRYDYRDVGHLNTSGALKVSIHLASYIKNNYEFEHSKENKPLGKYNRYFLMDGEYKTALTYRKIKNEELVKSTGAEEIFLYVDDYGRLEVLLIGDEIKGVVMKVEYEISKHEARNIPIQLNKRIKDLKFSYTTRMARPIPYKGNEFKFLTINCDFNEVFNLQIYIGEKAAHSRVLNIENIKFK